MLKNDDVIKKIMWPWLLFWCFLKDFTLYHTHAKYHILGFSGSGFMEERRFAFTLDYSILKKPSLVRAKAIVRNNSEKSMFVKIHVLKKAYVTKLFNRIQDGLFQGCSRMGGELFAPPPPLPKIRRTYPKNGETWHSYTLPKKDPKNV